MSIFSKLLSGKFTAFVLVHVQPGARRAIDRYVHLNWAALSPIGSHRLDDGVVLVGYGVKPAGGENAGLLAKKAVLDLRGQPGVISVRGFRKKKDPKTLHGLGA